VITHLRNALKAGVLKSDKSTEELRRLLSIAYTHERHPRWIVFLDEIVSKAHFLKYATRYVRRPPIASWRLLKVTDQEVEFLAKDTKTKKLVPTRCQLPEFIRLLAPHAPDHYKHAIRYFGFLSPRAKGRVYAALFVLLGQTRRPRPERLSWRDSLLKDFGVDPLRDSLGQPMHWIRREKTITG
jgi:hypothetical protein